jgi:hypothetical protein
MTANPRPPRLALVLLSQFVPEQEALIGDLLEEYERRRSRLWFWRQTLVAVVVGRSSRRSPARPLGLSKDPGAPAREELHLPINLSASPVRGVGGLGLVALAALVAIVRPEAWWFVAAAVAGGILLGVIKVVLTRRRFRADPDAFVAQRGLRFR